MQYKLLAVTKSDKLSAVNIGDFIQALASSQYYPKVDGFVDRDVELKKYDGEPCKMIMNGWYMHNPEEWPPSDKIKPLFVAFHLNTLAKEYLLSAESLAYLKKHEPIGCRDTGTMEALRQHGIDAYFSACMTLTLGKKYHSEEKEDKTYIVDPLYLESFNFSNVLKAISILIRHPKDVSKLVQKEQLYVYTGRNKLKKVLRTALFYNEYVKFFGRKLVMESEYVTQDDPHYTNDFETDEERLKEAERLVRKYAKAKLVITSRIHCALPCLGLETPVIYLEKGDDITASTCRMGGLKDFFNSVLYKKGKLKTDLDVQLPLTPDNCPPNKDDWKKFAQALNERCSAFVCK